MAEPLIVIKDLRKSFQHMGRELQVLKGIDLIVGRGEFTAIVGPSGAGKSTLLHCIGTLDVATAGQITLSGQDLVGLSSARLADIRNRTIGFVFQFHHLLPEFDALENVMMPGLIQGRGRVKMEPIARELLATVGLDKRATHRPGELSGGEQQRVALARALVMSPKLVLADEPTGNLDSASSEAVHELLFRICDELGTTIIVVTHNLRLAQSMPRLVTLRDGKIHADEYRSAESMAAAGEASPSATISQPGGLGPDGLGTPATEPEDGGDDGDPPPDEPAPEDSDGGAEAPAEDRAD